MLADRFAAAVDRIQQQAAARQASRDARDAFIVANWPTINTNFTNMVRSVTGAHPRLAIVSTTVSDTLTGHSFASLDKTVTTVVSTLYGAAEQVQFTPALESIEPNQFGVIRIAVDGFTPTLGSNGNSARFRSLLDRGVIVEGQANASLSVKLDDTSEPLSADLLESFLATLLVRTN